MRRVVALAFLWLLGCGSAAPFVWVRDVPQPYVPKDGAFVIRETDTVNVRVFNQEAISTRERVRSDGRITVPLVGEILARGRRPSELAKELEARLRPVVVAPSVAVTVDQSAQVPVSVLGEVRTPGSFQVDPGSNVLVALASAGGLSDYADGDSIFLLRKGYEHRIRFRISDLKGGDRHALDFGVQAGDVIVVE